MFPKKYYRILKGRYEHPSRTKYSLDEIRSIEGIATRESSKVNNLSFSSSCEIHGAIILPAPDSYTHADGGMDDFFDGMDDKSIFRSLLHIPCH